MIILVLSKQQAEIDMILVGDSLGMTVLGYDSTVQVTLNDDSSW